MAQSKHSHFRSEGIKRRVEPKEDCNPAGQTLYSVAPYTASATYGGGIWGTKGLENPIPMSSPWWFT
jgi:hypothetical protein